VYAGKAVSLGKKAKVALGVAALLCVGALAAAIVPGFFVVRRSPCVAGLHAIATAQKHLHAERNLYTGKLSELEGIVVDLDSPYLYALDTAHPSGLTVGCPGCQFVATCRSNVPNRDLWSIASVERSIRGETVPAFAPFHDINGE
jgi:hypothetical protein